MKGSRRADQTAASPFFAAVAIIASSMLLGTNAQNRAICRFDTTLVTTALSEDGFTEAVMTIGQTVCGEGGSAVNDIDKQVAAVASAIAEVVSEIDFECTLEGTSTADVTVSSLGDSRASAVGNAVAEVLAETEACMSCEGVVSALVNTTATLTADATFENVFRLNLASSSGTPISERRRIVEREVQQNVTDILSSITGTIRSEADNCEIDLELVAQVGDDFATCTVLSSSDVTRIAEDAVVELIGEVRVFVCDSGSLESEFDQLLMATATALVDAVSQVDAFCETRGSQATGCAVGETIIEAVARAEATAFASGLAEAGTCFCNQSVSINASAVEEIFVQTGSAAFAQACSSGTDSSFMSDFAREVEERQATAVARFLAEVSATAMDDSGTCSVGPVEICVEVCAPNNQICRGEDVEPEGETLACCNSDYECRRRSSAESRCIRRSNAMLTLFPGALEAPTVPMLVCE